MQVQAVTFDFWNTLVLETHEPVELRKALWLETLVDSGHAATESQIDAAFTHAWKRFEGRWKANEQSSAEDMTADAVAHLPFDVEYGVEVELARAYLEASLITVRELLPGVEKTLAALDSRGVAVGVVSDIGAVPGTQIRRWMTDLGVDRYISHWSFSDEVGTFKPDPVIFDHALDGLGVDNPQRAAHVGDLRRTDIAGANAMGMISVQYIGARKDPANDEPGSAVPDHVIDSHGALLARLGLDTPT